MGSLDIGHSDGSTSASEVTAEAGGSPMFMVQIRPLSRCTEHRNEVLDTRTTKQKTLCFGTFHTCYAHD